MSKIGNVGKPAGWGRRRGWAAFKLDTQDASDPTIVGLVGEARLFDWK